MEVNLGQMIKSLLIAILIASCQKDSTISNKEASEYFPNKIGNYWKYAVYDSTSLKSYDVDVSIIGLQTLIDNENAYVWQYQYPWGKDTNYVRVVGDTIKIYDKTRVETSRGLQFPLNTFIIPFHGDQRWDGKLLLIDSSHVTAEPSIQVSSGIFKNGFSIYHHYIAPNLEYNDTYWFIPNVGMVKMYYNHYNLGPRSRVLWQLKKYYLN